MKRVKPHEQGVALLLVVVALAIVAVLAMGLVLETRLDTRESADNLEASEARAMADAITLRSAVALLDESAPDRPRVDGIEGKIEVLGQPVQLTITSEFGKVDLNAASETMLSQLLEGAGLGPATATAEAHLIVERRSGGSIGTMRPYLEIEELTQVEGIDGSLFATLTPAITVYSGQSRVDQSIAPLLALEAAGLDRLGAEQQIRAREQGFSTAASGETVLGQLTPGISITGWAFRLDEGFVAGRDRWHNAAVVRMTGSKTAPFLLLWQQINKQAR